MINGTSITETEVLAKQRYLRAYLQGNLADSNLKEGSFFNEILIKPASYLALLFEKEADRVVNSLNIDNIAQVEDRTSAQVLDDLASNFFLTRKRGTNSQGVLRLELSSRSGFVIPANTIFTKSIGVEFFYAGAAGQNEPLVVSSEDLTEETDSNGAPTGKYYFDIVVESTVSFIGSGLSPGEFLSATPAIPGVSRMYNFASFSLAEGEETNESFASRIKSALTTRGLYSKYGIESSILDSIGVAQSVRTIGAASAGMRRDVLSINATEVRVLGKANVYANTGFYTLTKSVSFGTNSSVDIPSSIARLADIRASFGRSLLSEVTTGSGEELVLLEDQLESGRAHGSSIGASEFKLSYSSPSNSIGLTNTSGPIYARTSLENGQLSVDSSGVAQSFDVVLSKGHSLVETLLQESSNKALGVDTLLYVPTTKRIKFTVKVRLREDKPGDLPTSFFKADVAGYINKHPTSGNELNLSDIVHYIMEEYSSYILNINLSNSTIQFSTLLPDGNKIYWDSSTSTSYSDSTPYYFYQGTKYSYSLQDGYLESLQVTDETSTVFCSPSDIDLEELT